MDLAIVRAIVIASAVALLPVLAVAQPSAVTSTSSPPPNLFQSPPPSDPTRLTTELMYREIATLEKSVNAQLTGIIKNADEFKNSLTRFPTEVDQKISQIEKLEAEITRGNSAKIDEHFAGIALQFKERDVRTEQAAIATKVAVDAALQAQEKAFAAQSLNFAASLTEIKATFGKLIENQQQLLATNTKGLDDKIAALTNQITAIDARSHGSSDSWSVMIAIGSLAAAVGMLLIVFLRPQSVRYVRVPEEATRS